LLICSGCHRTFKTQRGLSQHERLVHPFRNENRQQAATFIPASTSNIAYAKVWERKEILQMVSFEHSILGHPRVGHQITGNTTKQIKYSVGSRPIRHRTRLTCQGEKRNGTYICALRLAPIARPLSRAVNFEELQVLTTYNESLPHRVGRAFREHSPPTSQASFPYGLELKASNDLMSDTTPPPAKIADPAGSDSITSGDLPLVDHISPEGRWRDDFLRHALSDSNITT
jgi:hypothetical protein